MSKKTISLKNITPKSMSCGPVFGCPAIYETEDDSFVIIGSITSKLVTEELGNAISKGEIAIKIPKKLLKGLKA